MGTGYRKSGKLTRETHSLTTAFSIKEAGIFSLLKKIRYFIMT